MPTHSINIEQKINELLNKNGNRHTSETHKKLAKAHDEFNHLIAKGIAEKKKLTLRGIEDTHLLHLRPN